MHKVISTIEAEPSQFWSATVIPPSRQDGVGVAPLVSRSAKVARMEHCTSTTSASPEPLRSPGTSGQESSAKAGVHSNRVKTITIAEEKMLVNFEGQFGMVLPLF